MRGIKKYLYNGITVVVILLWSLFNKMTFLTKIKAVRTKFYSEWMSRRFNSRNCIFLPKINFKCGEKYFHIGKGTHFGKEAVLSAWDSYESEKFTPEVKIGENCNFGDYLHLTCANSITIGNGVLTGRWVTITDNGHGRSREMKSSVRPQKRCIYSKGPVRIGDNVWIGDKVTILPGVTIGEGCIIGANRNKRCSCILCSWR